MNHALLLSLLIAYKAFMGNFLLGVIPEDVNQIKNISSYYSLKNSINFESPYKISKNIQFIEPIIESKSALAADLGSDKILYSKDSYKKRQIASITKLMTAIIVMDKANLDDVVIISSNASNIIGSSMNLYQGEKITVKDLLFGLLINSANDAGIALAEHVSGSEEMFVKEMNKYVSDIGLVNTHFDSAVGLDSINNYSTAFEVYLLSKEFLKYPLLRTIVTNKELSVFNTSGGEHKLVNTNKNLDSFLNVKGIKTGTTDMAGESLVNLIENDNGYEYLVVLLDSPRRFSESKIIAEWVNRAFVWN